MSKQISNEEPKKILIFEEHHEGYWTGDGDSACFNPISPDNPSTDKDARYRWYNACTYIRLVGLEAHKKYRVKLTVEAEEIA